MPGMTETFTNRHLKPNVVGGIDGSAVTDADGWTATAPEELVEVLQVGDEYELEMLGGPFGRITGWRYRGRWYRHDSDQQIEVENRRFSEDLDRRHRESLERNRADWVGRTENLPGWLQERIQTFRERGGKSFEINGWGYELIICELAVLYDQDPNFGPRESYSYRDEAPEIGEYAEREGTSGSQHDIARALVARHRAGQSLAGTVSGLTPLTGDPFYEGRDG